MLFNASPDIRQQINETPELQPRSNGPLRSTPIAAVCADQRGCRSYAGLLSLRERQPFVVYATARVLRTLENNSIFRVLNEAVVERRELPLSGTCALEGPDGPLGLTIETFTVPGKVALFLEDEDKSVENFGTQEGDTIGLRIAIPTAKRRSNRHSSTSPVAPAWMIRFGTGSEALPVCCSTALYLSITK